MPRRHTAKRLESMRLHTAGLYARRIAQGLCKTCGTAAEPERKMCADCLVRNSGYQLARRKRRHCARACIYCGKPSRPERQSCADCGSRRVLAARLHRGISDRGS